MKLQDMKEGRQYVVTTGGPRATLRKGDRVRREHDDCLDTGHGWLTPDHWRRLRNEVELDVVAYEKMIASYEEKIAEIRAIIAAP